MVKLFRIFIIAVLAIVAATEISLAQDAQGTESEAEMYFAAGTVVEASANTIVISEYDFDAGQESSVSYDVTAQTEFFGAASALDLKRGDDLEIEYQAVGDKRIAIRVEKYAAEEDEAYVDDMTNGMGNEEKIEGETMTEEEVNDEVFNAEDRAKEAAEEEAGVAEDAAADLQNDVEQKMLNDEGASIETKF